MISQDLQRLEAAGKPIRVGVSGAGWMGSGFVAQVVHVPGMQVNLIADTDVDAARHAFLGTGLSEDDLVEVDTPGGAMDALRMGRRVVTASYELAACLEAVDIVADLTPDPSIGAQTGYACVQNGKDVVLVNIEADVTVGRALNKLATQAGSLYTVSSGDEPGCLIELYDFVLCLGFEPVVLGKGKNNPLDPSATPRTVADAARRSGKEPYQVASYVDGTKTMIEMACVSNATGCPPSKTGMLGPVATIETVSEVFALRADGGLVETPGVVDFVQGPSMAGGVFVTVRVRDRRIQADLEYLKVGSGEYFTFFRPYHLWFIEAPISVARAYLFRQPTLVPLKQPVAEVVAVTKRSLQPGEILDGFGGYAYYGLIDRFAAARERDALPIGLAPGARVVRSVPEGGVLTWSDVQLDESSVLVRLRRQQDGDLEGDS